MIDSNKSIVQSFLAASRSGNLDKVKQLLHPEVRIVEAESLPFGGTVTGVDGFTRLVRQVFMTFTDTAVELDEFIAEGDAVVVLATLIDKSKATGEAFRTPISEIWRLLADRIVEIRPFYHDTQKVNM